MGILFTGGEGPDPRILERFFGDALTGAMIVAADSGLVLAEAAGLKPDWIIGDMDSLDEQRLKPYPAEIVIRHSHDKDFTDTELALALLREKGCDEVWIAGGGGGRIDHLLGIRDLFEREQFPRRWITSREYIQCINGGLDESTEEEYTTVETFNCVTGEISKTGHQMIFSVFPLGAGPWKAESTGLKWPLDNVHWERGLYGLSNVAAEAEVSITAVQGRFLIITEGAWYWN